MPSQKTNKQSGTARSSTSSRGASTEPVQIIHSSRIAQSAPAGAGSASPYTTSPFSAGPYAASPFPATPYGADPFAAQAGVPWTMKPYGADPATSAASIQAGAAAPTAGAPLSQVSQAAQSAQAAAVAQAGAAAQSAQSTQSLLAIQAAQAAQAASAAQSAQFAQAIQAVQAAQAASAAQAAQAAQATAAPATMNAPSAGTAFGSAPSASDWMRNAASAPSDAFVTPQATVSDEGSAYSCTIDLPGISSSDINLTCANSTLYVHAVRRAEPGVTSIIHAEQNPSQVYRRAIQLPSEINAGQAEAKLSSGTLLVRLPKANPTEAPSLINVQD